MGEKTYLILFKLPQGRFGPVTAASAEIQGDHLVLLDSHGRGIEGTDEVTTILRTTLTLFGVGVTSSVPSMPGCPISDRCGVGKHLGSKIKSRELKQINFFTSSCPFNAWNGLGII